MTCFDENKLEAFLFKVGTENVVCKTHNRKMADSLSRSVQSGDYKPEYYCEAWLELPQLQPCIFVKAVDAPGKNHAKTDKALHTVIADTAD